MVMQDTGMRPSEVFAIRLEDIHWSERRIWIPSGKTERSRRFVGISGLRLTRGTEVLELERRSGTANCPP